MVEIYESDNSTVFSDKAEERMLAYLARKNVKKSKRHANVERILRLNCPDLERRRHGSGTLDTSDSSAESHSSAPKLCAIVMQSPEPAHRVSHRKHGSPNVWLALDADAVDHRLRSWTS